MRKSKLEYYQEILETLTRRSLTVDNLAYKTSADCTVLQQRLDFLITQGLIKEQILSGRALCVITERGVAVLKALDLQKRLEQVKTTIKSATGNSQIVPPIAEYERSNSNC